MIVKLGKPTQMDANKMPSQYGNPMMFDGKVLSSEAMRHMLMDLQNPQLGKLMINPTMNLHELQHLFELTRQPNVTSKPKKEHFVLRVNLDVHHFQPEEITVKAVENAVTVEGKHEEKPDGHGYISRHFVRRYVLPDGIDDVSKVQCTLSSDGILRISVPKKALPRAENEIPITYTNAPAITT